MTSCTAQLEINTKRDTPASRAACINRIEPMKLASRNAKRSSCRQREMPLPAATARRHDDGIDAAHQRSDRLPIAKVSRHPLDGMVHGVEAAKVALRAMPAAKMVARLGQVPGHIAPQESRCSGQGDVHGHPRAIW